MGVAKFQIFFGVCLIFLIFFGVNSRCWFQAYLSRKKEITPPPPPPPPHTHTHTHTHTITTTIHWKSAHPHSLVSQFIICFPERIADIHGTSIILPAKSRSDVMFCLQSYGLTFHNRINTQLIYRFELAQR